MEQKIAKSMQTQRQEIITEFKADEPKAPKVKLEVQSLDNLDESVEKNKIELALKQYDNAIRTKIAEPMDKAEQRNTANAIPTLERSNPEQAGIFLIRFKQYLKTLGLLNAVQELGCTHLDLTRDDNQDITYSVMKESLRTDPNTKHQESWLKANTTLQAKLSDDLTMDLIDVDKDPDFFDVWQDVMQLLNQSESAMARGDAMTDIQNLEMGEDQTLMAFLKEIESKTNKVNRMSNQTIYGHGLRQAILVKGIKVHHSSRFSDAVKEVRKSRKQMSWETIKQTFKTLDLEPDSTTNKKQTPTSVGDTNNAIALQIQAKLKNTNGKVCAYCKKNGHTENACYSKKRAAKRLMPCWEQQSHGRCTFKERTGRDCGYQHSVATTNTIATQPQVLQPQQQVQQQQLQQQQLQQQQQQLPQPSAPPRQANTQLAMASASGQVTIEDGLRSLGMIELVQAVPTCSTHLSQARANTRNVIFDTGATDHATDDKDKMSFLQPSGMVMQSANGSYSEAPLKGTLPAFKDVELDDVLLVEDFKNKNIISWSALDEKGFSFAGRNGKIQIFTPDGKLWQTAVKRNDRLFHLVEMEASQ